MCVPCKVFILIKYICIVISVIYIIILLLLITFTQYSTDMFYDVIFRYCRFIFKEIYWVGLWHAATKNTCNVKFLALFSFRSERLYWMTISEGVWSDIKKNHALWCFSSTHIFLNQIFFKFFFDFVFHCLWYYSSCK